MEDGSEICWRAARGERSSPSSLKSKGEVTREAGTFTLRLERLEMPFSGCFRDLNVPNA